MENDDLPAILGGPPVNPAGPPSWPVPDEDVLTALTDSYRSGNWGVYHGSSIPLLEQRLADWLQKPFVQTCASGTLALEAALHGFGVSHGDEVIMGAYDYEPNFLSVLALGAKPVLVDSCQESPVLNAHLVSSVISSKTKAIIATHLHGGLVEMALLMAIAQINKLPVVEDAAQSPGGAIHGKAVGQWGDACIVSFGGSKLLSSGRGGAVAFRQESHAQRARLFLTRGVQHWGILSELQSTVLLPQLAKIEARTIQRHVAVKRLRLLLQNVPGLKPIQPPSEEDIPGYYKWGFYFSEPEFGLSRDRFVKAIRAEGIAFDVGFKCVHSGRSPKRFSAPASLNFAEKAGREIVMLHHPVLLQNEESLDQVARAVWKTHRHAERLA